MAVKEELAGELTRVSTQQSAPEAFSRVPLEFHTFSPATETPDLVAVDGSYSFLLNLSSWWLAVLTVGSIRYGLDGGYAKRAQHLDHRIVAVSTREDFVRTQSNEHQKIFEMTQGRTAQHNEMVNEFRHWEEMKLTLQAAKDHTGLIVAIDGGLSSFPKENDLMAEIVQTCEKNDHLLVGVSKDSDLHAYGSPVRDEDLLRRRQHETDGCAYVRPPDLAERQKGLLHGDVYYARLHPNASKWFRVDVGTQREDPARAIARVAAYCRARHSLGYPLPLMEAHRMAVTVRHFQPLYEQMLLHTARDLGMDLREVVNGLTRVEGKRKSAFHEYLDRLTGDRR